MNFYHCVSCGRAGVALPDLPFTGYIQAKPTVGLSLSILQRWLDAMWTPVGSKLCYNTNIWTNSSRPTMLPLPFPCIYLFAGYLPSGPSAVVIALSVGVQGPGFDPALVSKVLGSNPAFSTKHVTCLFMIVE